MKKPITVALALCIVWSINDGIVASALAQTTTKSFVQLNPVTGSPVFFDPMRITAVVALPNYELAAIAKPKGSLELFFPLPAAPMSHVAADAQPITQVLGIFANLMPVRESVDDVLNLAGRNQFIQVTLLSGAKAWMKASAIGWVMRQYPGAGPSTAGSYVGLGLEPGHATALKEDVDTVRHLIEAAARTAHPAP